MTVPLFALAPLVLATVLLAMVRPRWAVLLPLVVHAAYQLRSVIPLGAIALPTTVFEGILVVAIVAGAWHGRRSLLASLRALPRGVVLAAILFLSAATVSAAVAPHARTGWGHWKAFVVEPMLYAVVLLPVLRTDAGRRQALTALLLGGVVSVGLSLAAVASCLLPPASCPVTPDFARLAGIYDVPNSLALVLAPLTVLAVLLGLQREATGLRRLARWSLVLFLPSLLLTQSLGGLFAAFAGSLMVRIATLGRGTRVAGSVAVGIAALVLAAGLGWQAWSGKLAHALAVNSPLAARLQIWQVSLSLIRDHPLLGTGLGTFEPAFQEKLRALLAGGNLEFEIWNLEIAPAQPVLEWVVRDPHNVLLSFWLNFGLIGFLAMTGLVVVALRRSFALQAKSYQLPSAAALVALLVIGAVDVPYLKNDLAVLWWAYLTLALVRSDARSALALSTLS